MQVPEIIPGESATVLKWVHRDGMSVCFQVDGKPMRLPEGEGDSALGYYFTAAPADRNGD